MFKISVFAIIFNAENQVLLNHRRDYDLWNLPGGRLNDNENPKKGVHREVKEEVGISIAITRLGHIYYRPLQQNIVFTFICHQTKGTLSLSDEADAVGYFSLSDLPKNLIPTHKQRILDVIAEPLPSMKEETDYSLADIVKRLKKRVSL